MTRWSVVAIAVFAGMLGLSPTAQAGSFTHYSCHLPDGTPIATEGWARYEAGPAAQIVPSSAVRDLPNRCSEPGSFASNGLAAELTAESFAGYRLWGYRPPAGLQLTRFVAARRMAEQGLLGQYNYGARAAFWINGVTWTDTPIQSTEGPSRNMFIGGDTLDSPAARLDSGPLAAAQVVYVGVHCYDVNYNCRLSTPAHEGDDGPFGPAAWVQVALFAATLEDPVAPTVTSVSGPLADASTHGGTEQITFDATDVGAGLYRAVAQAKIFGTGDWVTLARETVDTNNGRCVDAGVDPSDDYEFTSQVPCATGVTNATLSVRTDHLPAGTHALRVYVEDAAGNTAAVIADRPFAVAERSSSSSAVFNPADPASAPPAINGAGASTGAIVRLKRPRRTIRHGQTTTIEGSLVDENDRGIAGATILVQQRSYVPKTGLVGGAWRPIGMVHTGRNGVFAQRLAAGPSRALRFVYNANPAQDGQTDAAEARISVRAGLKVRVARSRIRNGQAAVFSGRVAGRIPRGGVIVALQAFIPTRGWTPALTRPNTARARADGRFRLSYRFTHTFRRTTYRFRIVVQEDSQFEYARSSSRTVLVSVRP